MEINYFESLGSSVYPLAAILTGILFLISKKTYELYFVKDLSKYKLKWGINSIVFWGGIALSVGALFQMLGFFYALDAIIHAEDISPTITIIGFFISFISTFAGLLIFIISAIAWKILKSRYNSLIRKTEEK